MEGNTDVQIALDFFAVITYISEYLTKDDTASMKNFAQSSKSSNSLSLKSKMELMMNTWLTHRQMDEAEIVYKLFKDFHFRESSSLCIFL